MIELLEIFSLSVISLFLCFSFFLCLYSFLFSQFLHPTRVSSEYSCIAAAVSPLPLIYVTETNEKL